MKPITLCLIVRDEENALRECVESCRQDFDHLVVVDTGSEDRTVEVAQELGATVHHFEWCDDFSAARNFAASKCETDWVLMPDADEVLDPECAGLVRQLVEQMPEDIAVIQPILDCGGGLKHQCDKLYRRSMAHWQNPSHNVLVADQGHALRVPELVFRHERHRRGDEQRAKRSRQRNEMNEANFRKLLAANPNDTRSAWYLALTVQEAGRHEEAIGLWDAYLKLGGWSEEIYEARRERAECLLQLNRTEDAIEQMILAHKDEPRRAELAMQLGDLYRNGCAWLRSEFWYKVAANIPDPVRSGCILFMRNDCYGPYPWLELADLYRQSGQDEKLQLAAKRCRELAGDNEDVLDRLRGIEVKVNSREYWDHIYSRDRDIGEGHRSLLRRIAELAGDGNVLDVGAGTGELLDLLPNAEGADFSRQAAAKHDRILQDDARSLGTQPTASRDVVVCCETLEHIEKEQQVLRSLRRVVKPEGKVIVSVPLAGAMTCAEHVREYTEQALREAIRHAGMDVTDYEVVDCWQIAICVPVSESVETPTLDFYVGVSHFPWGPETAAREGLRGSHAALLHIAQGLARRGWRPRIWCDLECGPTTVNGVEWRHYQDFDPTAHRDVCVACRKPALFDKPVSATVKVYRHDDATEGYAGYQGLPHFFVSEWQSRRYGIAGHVILPGVDTDLFKPGEMREKSLVFAAQPQRGLEQMLQMWPALRQKLGDDWVLNIYGSFETWRRERPEEADKAAEVERLLLETQGIVFHGMVTHQELAEALGKAMLFVYPSTYPETACALVLEAQACGTPIVARAYGALTETCAADCGVLVDGDPNDQAFHEEFVRQCADLIADEERWRQCSDAGRTWVPQNATWDLVCEKWDSILRSELAKQEDTYIRDRRVDGIWGLASNGYFRFLHDLARGKRNALEVGSHKGATSTVIANEVERLWCIDAWFLPSPEPGDASPDRYTTFLDNMRQRGLERKVVPICAKSEDLGADWLTPTLDLLHIDGDHSSEGVQRDLDLFVPKVAPGGIVVFHDMWYDSVRSVVERSLVEGALQGFEECGRYVRPEGEGTHAGLESVAYRRSD